MWPKPKITPVLDSAFCPAKLANMAFRAQVAASGCGQKVSLALKQPGGDVFRYGMPVFDDKDETLNLLNLFFVERTIKFLLWSRGGASVYYKGPALLGRALKKHYLVSSVGKFDSHVIGKKIYRSKFRFVICKKLPRASMTKIKDGGHLDGYRIGFDLGASDRKAASVVHGKVVFSEEKKWDPVNQKNPKWHLTEIMDSLRTAASHMERVDAIGGSSAGVYVNNEVRIASLFRSVPENIFNKKVKRIFFDIQKLWHGIPVKIVNDGEVTALAGAMSIKANSILGIAMGSSEATGYVDKNGKITTWLNELAFAPVDYSQTAPVDEWSKDKGCGVLYFSQQCVGRLISKAGIKVDEKLSLPVKLEFIQGLLKKGDNRAKKIFETIGVYLGYTIAHYADFYKIKHVLILGRVTSGRGGGVICTNAKKVLKKEFPSLYKSITLHIPNEREKRHGQAIAAASLPIIKKRRTKK